MTHGGLPSPDFNEPRARRARVIRTLSARSFLEVTEEEVDRANRYDRPLSVLIGQFEGVKRIRRAEGSMVAEEVVATAVERIHHGLRSMDRIGRLGVGEFSVLLPETRLGNAEMAAMRLRDSFSADPVETRGGPRPIFLNIGIGTLNPRLRNAKSFLMLAYSQLRLARRVGGGEISTVPPELVRVSVARNSSIH